MDEVMSPSSTGKRKRQAAPHRPMSPIERLQADAEAETEDELDNFRQHKRYLTEVCACHDSSHTQYAQLTRSRAARARARWCAALHPLVQRRRAMRMLAPTAAPGINCNALVPNA